MTIAASLVVLGCGIATFYDFRERRIPNWLTGALASIGLALAAIEGGATHALANAGAGVMLLFVGTFLYSRGWFGGGDVKLAAAASVALGYPDFLVFLLYGMLAGGAIALAQMFSQRGLRSSAGTLLMLASGTMRVQAVSKATTIPYAAAFAVGALVTVLSHTVAPFLRIIL